MKLLRRTANNLVDTAFQIGGELARLSVAVVGRLIRLGAEPSAGSAPPSPPTAAEPRATASPRRRTDQGAPRPAPAGPTDPAVQAPADPVAQIEEALDADGVLRLAKVAPDARDEVIDLEAELDEVRGAPGRE